MACPRLVVIGASAGGLEAVREVLSGLGPDFPAAVLIVIHTGSDGTTLPAVLGRSTPLPVAIGRDGERLARGRVYVPPPNCHLMVDGERLALTRGPRQHGFRPAVDPLFISAASSCRGNVIGVVLSGALDDGALGLMAIKRSGGIAVVQNPEEAAFPSMPLTALKSVEVDYVLPAAEIAPRLLELSRAAIRRPVPPAGGLAASGDRGEGGRTPVKAPRRELTALVCPSCGGALWESREQGVDEYLCHVGHHFSPAALRTLQLDQLDHVLWSAVRALHEDSMLRKRMAQHAEERGMRALAREWHAQARAAEANVDELRRLIERVELPAMTPLPVLGAADGRAADGRPGPTTMPTRRQGDERLTARPGGRDGKGAARERMKKKRTRKAAARKPRRR